MITITIAELPSSSPSALVWEGEAGTTVGAILDDKDVSSDGRVIKLNGVEVSRGSTVNSDGMITVTQGAKGNS